MTVEPYTPALRELWDDAVRKSRNGLFQHLRAYMDYHSDRFADCSLLARDAKGRVVAVLPAHAAGSIVCSHRGLSFGGWLMGMKADMPSMMAVWQAAADYYRSQGFTSMYYRPAPYIYHRYPVDEDLYALYRAGGRLEASQVSTVVDLSAPAGLDMNYRRCVRKAMAAGLEIRPTDDYASYWSLLGEVLASRHSAAPVHSLDEIELLRSRFPDNIRLYGAYAGDALTAGVVMYCSGPVAHCQYIAAGEEGRRLHALPLLFSRLMADAAAEGFRWFDFGTSCEEGGRVLNEGLVRQKCAFGGRAVVFNAYTVGLSEL